MNQTKSAFSRAKPARQVAAELASQFGTVDARAIIFFCSHTHDGAALSAALREHYPEAEVIGCTTAGEFVEDQYGEGNVAAIVLGPDKARAASSVLATFVDGVEDVTREAAESIARRLRVDLRSADPSRYVGIVLIDGLHMTEERVNQALGEAAPLLSFVGGSAGDNLAFQQTYVFRNGVRAANGAVFLLLEMAVPFTVVKTCSFESTGKHFTITKADVENRTVYEVDGRPVVEAYAEALGLTPDDLTSAVFMSHPVGLMDSEPWVRSPQQVTPNGGLKFYCQILEGMDVHLMRGTDLIGETKAAFAKTDTELGGPRGGAVVFNCILRRLQMDVEKSHEQFLDAIGHSPVAGFHTYGESWLGHINQTCTALVFA